ncbi:hypothetical protein K491DRAFT_752897 [Lophiostoma macrostomum CBS 122681]|uniref:Uncharacterized protein n=1 Tax=Lophiostoma macrostomum CBS 122681 TaxID=1314788 RepID=A0A6A6TT49_9PLEO|nr:hypothetical protein K491DRAFT_752897 [Lophiostoma macrostomum CBS 122681]
MPAPFQKLCQSLSTRIHRRPSNRNANDSISSSRSYPMTHPPDEVDQASSPQTHELVHLVDGEPSKRKSQAEKDGEYWNSVMTEGKRRAKESYTEALRYRPYQRTLENHDPLPGPGQWQREVETSKKNLEKSNIHLEGESHREDDDEGRDSLDDLGYFNFVKSLDRSANPRNNPHITQIDFAPNPYRNSSTLAVHSKQSSKTPTILGRSTSDVGSRPPTPYPGARSPISQLSPTRETSREEDANSQDGENAVAAPSPWELGMDKIMSTGRVSASQMQAFKQTLQETPTLDLCRRGSTLSTIAQGLFPNFSRPLPAISSSRPSSSRYSSSDAPRDNDDDHTLPNGLTNGDSSIYLSRSRSSSPHRLPSGLPLVSELDLLVPTPPSSPVDDKTLIARHEGTIATQAFLVKQLHRIIDSQRKRGEYLEDEVLPSYSGALEDSERLVELMTGMSQIMTQEIADLKIACETSSRLLGACWAREWHLWGWLDALGHKKSSKSGGILAKLFGGRGSRQQDRNGKKSNGHEDFVANGSRLPHLEQHAQSLQNGGMNHLSTPMRDTDSPTSTTGLSRKELDAVTETAFRNLETTREDVGDTARLVKGCEDRKIIAIQEMFGEAQPEPGSWRDV